MIQYKQIKTAAKGAVLMLFDLLILLLAFLVVNIVVFYLFGRAESSYDKFVAENWRHFWMHQH